MLKFTEESLKKQKLNVQHPNQQMFKKWNRENEPQFKRHTERGSKHIDKNKQNKWVEKNPRKIKINVSALTINTVNN